MKLEHLKSMLFQKNKRGRYREITIIPKTPKHEYQSGGQRSVSDYVYLGALIATYRLLGHAASALYGRLALIVLSENAWRGFRFDSIEFRPIYNGWIITSPTQLTPNQTESYRGIGREMY